MINWYRKRKLVALIESLAIYNDKGIEWSKHNSSQVEARRQKLLSLIRALVTKLGQERISNQLLEALEGGNLASDVTGIYVVYAKQTKL